MKNFSRSDISIDDALTSAGKGLHKPKSVFFAKYKDELKQASEEYDRKASAGDWEGLVALWNVKDKMQYYSPSGVVEYGLMDMARDLYGSNRRVISEHWDVMRRMNGGDELLCPICEIEPCKEMDHYVPREIMPEFSIHLSNLIPLCHNCNHDKHAFWLNSQGQRWIFNAFYDRLDKDVYLAVLTIDSETGNPVVDIILNPQLNQVNMLDIVIKNTEEKLNLSSLYKRKCNQRLASLIEEWNTDYKLNSHGMLSANYITQRFKTMRSLVVHHKSKDIVERLLYRAILASNDFQTWIVNFVIQDNASST